MSKTSTFEKLIDDAWGTNRCLNGTLAGQIGDNLSKREFPTLIPFCTDRNRALPPSRVCILTKDIFGPIKNGGIGTSCYYMATGLAKAWE